MAGPRGHHSSESDALVRDAELARRRQDKSLLKERLKGVGVLELTVHQLLDELLKCVREGVPMTVPVPQWTRWRLWRRRTYQLPVPLGHYPVKVAIRVYPALLLPS